LNDWGWLAVGGAATLVIGGACVLLGVLEADNRRKANDLARIRSSCEDELRQARARYEGARSIADAALRVDELEAAFQAKKQTADLAYEEYARAREDCKCLYEAICQARKAKAYLKRELDLVVDKVKKESRGKWVDFRKAPEIVERKRQISDYSAFIKSTSETLRMTKENKDSLLAIVKECNSSAKEAHEIARQSREESITLICKTCGRGFDFTAGEARFFDKRGFSYPKNCPKCRSERKSRG